MRVQKSKKGFISTYLDNFSIKIVFSGLPRARSSEKENQEEKSAWNLRKEGGWDEYKKQTENIATKIVDIVQDNTKSIEKCMKEIDAVNNKVKFASFGKTRKTEAKKKPVKDSTCVECKRLEGGPGSAQCLDAQQRSMALMSSDKENGARSAPGVDGQLSKVYVCPDWSWMDGQPGSSTGMDSQKRKCSSCKTEEEKLKEVLQTQSKRLEDEINDIKKTRAGRTIRIFKMKQKIVGDTKVGQ